MATDHIGFRCNVHAKTKEKKICKELNNFIIIITRAL
jgi:hypothetical protein